MKSISAISIALCVLAATSTSLAAVTNNGSPALIERGGKRVVWTDDQKKKCAVSGGIVSCCFHKKGNGPPVEGECTALNAPGLWGNTSEAKTKKKVAKGGGPGKSCPPKQLDHGPYCCSLKSRTNENKKGAHWECLTSDELDGKNDENNDD